MAGRMLHWNALPGLLPRPVAAGPNEPKLGVLNV
jgi:hypothetical protein